MSVYLLIDFGSTYTKVIAVDIEKEVILGRAQSPTTIGTDIMIGLNRAVTYLSEICKIDLNHIDRKYACSSAAGGLKMIAIGLVPTLTLEAAHRAALGAGAKVLAGYGFEIDRGTIGTIESAGCDIILLCGGTDGGDKNVIVHNAKMLADSKINCPILVAGNRVVADEVRSILEGKNKKVYIAKNVLPSLDVIDVEPAQALIREIFITHIMKAKGLEEAQDYVGKPIIPTPRATLQAAALLSDGAACEAGIGSILVVEVGGATVNIHSVAEVTAATPQTMMRGLPELRIKRTVEGDLGIRYNAQTICDSVGLDKLQSALQTLSLQDSKEVNIERYIKIISGDVKYVPISDGERNLDIALAKSAVSVATERHAGTLKQEYSIQGEITVQYGKNLLDVKNVIGTGGIFKYGLNPERIFQSALYEHERPWSLRPKSPEAHIDSEYILFGIGLLAEDFPEVALRMAKKYLRRIAL